MSGADGSANREPGATALDCRPPAEPQHSFEWTNEQWAETHLPIVRIASLLCTNEAAWVVEKIERVRTDEGKSGTIDNLLREFDRVRQQLRSMLSLIDAAEARMTS